MARSMSELASDLIDGIVDPSETSPTPFQPRMALEALTSEIAFVSSFANAAAIRTRDGLVLVDTGSFLLSAHVHAALRQWEPRAPARAIVFSHGHVDHCFGVERWDADAGAHGSARPTVYAHARVPARFDRYRLTREWNGCINGRQFGGHVEWPASYRYPDVTYEGALTLDVGGERFELFHARGETDDATWVFVPGRRLLCTGDLFLWVCPNAGNPQKVQRYPRDWALALRAMIARRPEILCPGHGLPIVGEERVASVLGDTAELLESLHDQTVALMNQGAKLSDVLATVRAPAHLLEKPYLRPEYDEPSFIVRNVWRLYGGWWDGAAPSLEPAPPTELAQELARLAGGSRVLADRALALSERGEHALATHLAELASDAAPRDAAITAIRRKVLSARADHARSLMARGIYRAAADEKRG
ncbi:MAG: alkyl sulfatase dimerization domain-containing protein [Sandaracinus sp.]